MKKIVLYVLGCLISLASYTQNIDLFAQVDSIDTNSKQFEIVNKAFKSTRIINSHSNEFLGKGILDFRILHRFAPLNQGIYDLFGLDNAYIRFGVDYGITNRLTIGVGRSTVEKQYDGFIKWNFLPQRKGYKAFPFSFSYVGGVIYATQNYYDSVRDLPNNRLYYYHQILWSRKFNDYFTLQLMPTLVHYNLTNYATNPNDLWSLGVGFRVRVSKRVNLVAEYYQQLNQNNPNSFNSVALGCDIETGGHVFQINLTNSNGMTERSFINETTNDVSKGQIHLGFNISRVFVVKKPKEFK